MYYSRNRVSYVIPPPADSVPCLQLPPSGIPRIGSTGPLLLPAQNVSQDHIDDVPKFTKHPRHRLGVASLALDTSTLLAGRSAPEGILYTGGRDGLVMSWDLGVPMKRRRVKLDGGRRKPVGRWEIMTGWADDVIDEEADEADERPGSDGDILGEVSATIGKRRRLARKTSIPFEDEWETDLDAFKPEQPTKFRQCAQTHTDWVNDILLCNYNQTVISASSDGTIKAWNPHTPIPSEPSTIGSHSDYVRCLAHCREKSWLASGSFDRTIKLWDLSHSSAQPSHAKPLMTLNPPDTTAPKSSVYAIAADPFGHAIASGSPERVVRMWDPRSGKRTAKLVGHTDNIRAILISEDSRYLLTGSADASIKLWSLLSQRCLHTFTYHTDSVWSLFSTHPSLEMFYSGDKSGLVCRVDVEDCADVSEGECIVLCQDTGGRSMASSEGVNKIIAMDDNLLWSASSSSKIQRWHVPQRRSLRTGFPPWDADAERLPTSSISTPNKSPLKAVNSSPSPSSSQYIHNSSAPSLQDGIATESWLRLQNRDDEMTSHGIPFQSLVKLTSPHDPYTTFSFQRGKDPEVATLYSAASVMSVPRTTAAIRSPQRAFITAHTSPLRSGRTEETMHQVNTARADYEEREIAADAVPLCGVPDNVIDGDHGLVRSIMLNDRIHALTVDTSGEVAVWDIVRAICRGKFAPEDVASASQSGSTIGSSGCVERSPREALEVVRERIEGEAVVTPWSVVDTKTGVLAVHLNEKCFEGEVYADEVGIAHASDEARLNIGKWALRNLFIRFITEERRSRHRHGTHSRGSSSSGSRREIYFDKPASPVRRLSSSSDLSKDSAKFQGSTTVISAPEMIPATSPAVVYSGRLSPLVTPMIPLQPSMEVLSTLTPMPAIGAGTNDVASPNPRPPGSESGHTSTTDYFSVRRTRSSVGHGGTVTPAPDDLLSPATPVNLKNEPKSDPSLAQAPNTPGGGLMGILKNFGKISGNKKTAEVGPTSGAVPVPESRAVLEELSTPEPSVIKTPRQLLLSNHLTPPSNTDAPPLSLPPNVSLIVSEDVPPGWTTIYRGTVASTGNDMGTLEEVLPLWLLEYLLMNKAPPVPVVKIGFVLLPWNKDPDGEQLPELLNTTQAKLTASRFLRIRRLITHVQERVERLTALPERSGTPMSSSSLDLSSNVKSSRPRSEDGFEILCNDVVLPLDISLAAVKQFVWRQSAELVMYYRRRL